MWLLNIIVTLIILSNMFLRNKTRLIVDSIGWGSFMLYSGGVLDNGALVVLGCYFAIINLGHLHQLIENKK